MVCGVLGLSGVLVSGLSGVWGFRVEWCVWVAGYETTASALAFTVYCLAANPDKCAKLLQARDTETEAVLVYDRSSGNALLVPRGLGYHHVSRHFVIRQWGLMPFRPAIRESVRHACWITAQCQGSCVARTALV